MVQWHGRALSLLVDVGDIPVLRVKENLSVILEVHLHNLVAKSEHDSMLCSHPFLDVDGARWILHLSLALNLLVSLDKLLFLNLVVVLFKVRLEVLQ